MRPTPAKRSSSSAADRFASVRASSSTTSCVHAAWALRAAGRSAGRRQQQSGDRFDRFRHLRHAGLRAAGCRRSRGRVPRHQRERRHARLRRTNRDQSGGRARAARGVRDHRQRSRSLDMAEDREKFDAALARLGVARPQGKAAHEFPRSARDRARARISGARASVVRAGRARRWRSSTTKASSPRTSRVAPPITPGAPLLVDKYLRGLEVEVDAAFDGEDILIPGIFEHIERAGIHSGDSISVYPDANDRCRDGSAHRRRHDAIARELGIRGLINIQFVIHDGELYIIEANPRASRTVPIISEGHRHQPRRRRDAHRARRAAARHGVRHRPASARRHTSSSKCRCSRSRKCAASRRSLDPR